MIKARLKQPPLKRPEKMPVDIIANHLDFSDQQKIIDALEAYQKKGDDRSWKHASASLNSDTLKKWGAVVNECRNQGFLNPVVIDSVITWGQLIGDNKNVDGCTVCGAKVADGSCRGRQVFGKGFDFKPCWEG
jgi:hypothetical protein